MPWPLHDVVGTRGIEAAALAATAPGHLMARAGAATARLAMALAPHARRIVALVGPGNNGGDALIAATVLRRHGREPQLLRAADPARLPADAADAWRQAADAGLRDTTDATLSDADLVIDGLLGLGASRAPVDAIARLIVVANAAGRPTLAIDLPSGLHADRGQPLGMQALRADWTLGLLTLKPGLFTAAGRDLAGDVWFDDLGVHEHGVPLAWLGARRAAPPPGWAVRQHAQHKGSFGDVLVVGGAAGMAGAAWLAARAAQTAGAGRVYVRLLQAEQHSAPWPELMAWRDAPAAGHGASRFAGCTVVAGCGGGNDIAAALPALLTDAPRLVLDADGLNAVAADAALRRQFLHRRADGLGSVITPHPLEAARLLGLSTVQVQQDRLAAAQRLADEFGCAVVLKGSGTVIATPGEPPWINASGNAMLATAGSGDVLAGWLGALWSAAPGSAGPAAAARAALHAARAATWLHGRAADLALARTAGAATLPLRAGDLIEAMAHAAIAAAAERPNGAAETTPEA